MRPPSSRPTAYSARTSKEKGRVAVIRHPARSSHVRSNRHITRCAPAEVACVVERRQCLAAAVAGGRAADCVHAFSDIGDDPAFLLHHAPQRQRGLRRPRQLPLDGRRSDLLAGAGQQFLVRARHDSDLDRAGPADGDLGQPQHARTRLPAPCLFHAHRAADDCGRQHLAVFLHAGLRIARPVARAVRPRGLELARRSRHGDGLPDRHGGLEGSRLLHDLLSRSPSAAFARSRGSGVRRGCQPLVYVPADHLSAADADHAVRGDQRGHQFVQAGGSSCHHDQGRSQQCQYVAALLHL